MADDVTLPGTGAIVATDDVGAKHYQIVKLALGAADAVDMHLDSGQQTMANSAPVAIASNQSAVPVSGSVTVSGTVSVSGAVDTELTTADLDTGAGTDTRAVVGLVGSASGGGALIPGSAADGLLVNLGANNDVTVTGAVTVSGSVTANAGTNLNTSLLALEAGGNLAGAATSLAILDDWDENDRCRVNPIQGENGVQGASGIVTTKTQRVVLATDVGLPAGTANIGDVDVLSLPAIPAGTNNIGDVDVLTLPALVAGTANIGDVDVLTLPALVAGTANIGDVDVLTVPSPLSTAGGGTEATAHRVTIANDSTGVLSVDDNGASLTIDGSVTASNATGNIAHDSVDSGNPVKVGGRAVNVFAAVANDDRSDLKTDLQGRVLVSRHPVETFWSVNRTFTSAQTGTVIKTPTGGKKLVVTKLILGSYGATAGRCILFFDDDTAFTQDTDQVLAAASFAPSTTSKPGLVDPAETQCLTADFALRITTDTALSIDVTVQGYEV